MSLLIVVHPGTLCGSADFHLGDEAAAVRTSIAKEIEQWKGRVVVISGDLDDELVQPRNARLFAALSKSDLTTYGSPKGRGLEKAAAIVASHFGCTSNSSITVTGAWHDLDGRGCVTCVADALRAKGISASISPNAPAADEKKAIIDKVVSDVRPLPAEQTPAPKPRSKLI